jgi:hypothetical protein
MTRNWLSLRSSAVEERALDSVRALRGDVNGEAVGHGIVRGDETAAFHEERSAAVGVQRLLEDVRGSREGTVIVAVAEGYARGDVRGCALMGKRRIGRDRIEAVGNRGQDVVIDFDEGGRVFGNVARLGDHHRDGLADIASLGVHQHHRREQLRDRRVGHEQRQRLLCRRRQVGIGQHEMHAGKRARGPTHRCRGSSRAHARCARKQQCSVPRRRMSST